MRDELMRRISVALDGEGLASDPEIQKELRANPDAAKYAKDLTRVNKWLATWPLPEPDAAAFEALALRIEQRMDDSLPALADVTAPPMFEDDDAVRDATVGLLESGEHLALDANRPNGLDGADHMGGLLVVRDEVVIGSRDVISVASGEPVVDPEATSAPSSPIARVLLEKRPARGAVEESSGENTGEPLSAADLELRLSQDPKPKKKKKKKAALEAPPPASLTPSGRPPAPPPRAVGAKVEPTKTIKESERLSIPSSPGVVAGSIAPVAELRPAKESRPSGAWWAFAAAACVGLGVFGAATMFETGSAPSSATAPSTPVVSASTAIMPSAPAAEPMPPPTVAPIAVPVVVDPVVDVAPEAQAFVQPDEAPAVYAARAEDPEAVRARAHASPSSAATGVGGSLYDHESLGPVHIAPTAPAHAPTDTHASPERARPDGLADEPTPRPTTVAPAPTTPPPPRATTTTTTTPTPPSTTTPTPAPPPSEPAEELPETPDRGNIQVVLQGMEPAVRACATGGEHGTADIDLVIAGSGRVTSAMVHGPFAGTPIGSCIARAVRGARFSAFSQPRFAVTYEFRL
jgi:hypothetical protein